ncbi:MAG: aminotransferase class I/II-fold pyridoxal phosphate-dependent enzyme [Lentisphaerae bacterium]|nr:aminotransferase class I/II-fold pyridoxal phosphate-dependent enzyme [Lentisphaerota bacterium]
MTAPKRALQTICAHGGERGAEERAGNASFVPPIVQSTLFNLGTSADAEALFAGERPGFTYSRFGNPTVERLALVLAQLEGGAGALVTASGNAATLCALTAALRGRDDRIVTHPDVYGGTLELVRICGERYRLPVEVVDPAQAADWQAAIARASVVLIETPSNPLLKLLDVEAVAACAHAAGAQLIVDNTVATPCNQQPLRLGADWVVHSVSKYLNGHSDMIGGCVISRAPLTAAQRGVHKNLGGTVNAMDAWLMLRGLRTFVLRMEAHNRNGAAVAEWLRGHPAVSRVFYPGLPDNPQAAIFRRQMGAGGALLSFELNGGEAAARAFLDRLQLVVHAVSLGGMESLATRPAATSHRGMTLEQRAAAGVSGALIRLSVGVEVLDDILADLGQALA